MFTPISKMPAELQAHLRYPPDIFSIQSAIYGRYHLKNPGTFYAASNAWQLSPTAGAGPKSQALLAENTYNSQGQLVSTTPARMSPQYQVYALPHTGQQVFTVSDAFVPASQGSLTNNNQNFNLTAWMVGQSDPDHYGQLDVYQTPQGTYGPANADAEISANTTVSSDISLLDQNGSEVLLGETLMVPIGNSMVYLRPMYVSPVTNPQPQLKYVVAVLGKDVKVDTSLDAVLSDLLESGSVQLPPTGGAGSNPGTNPGSSGGTVPAQVAAYLQQAQTDYQNALAALKAQDLAGYQSDIEAMSQQLTAAQALLPGSTSGSGATTTTTAPAKKAKKSTKSIQHHADHVGRHRNDLEHGAGRYGGHDGDVHPGADDHRADRRGHDDDHAASGLGGAVSRGVGAPARRLRPGPGRPMMGGRKHRSARSRGKDEAMGLLDKVKDAAQSATVVAKDAAAKGQAKLDEAQAKRAADGLLRDLGAAYYATKSGRATHDDGGRHRPPDRRPQGPRGRARSDHAGPRIGGGQPVGGAVRRLGSRCRRPRRRRRPTQRRRHPRRRRPRRRCRSAGAGRGVAALRLPWAAGGRGACRMISSPRGGAVW